MDSHRMMTVTYTRGDGVTMQFDPTSKRFESYLRDSLKDDLSIADRAVLKLTCEKIAEAL